MRTLRTIAALAVTVPILGPATASASAERPSEAASVRQPVGSVILLSHDPQAGWRPRRPSGNPAISAGGRFAAYTSAAPLAAGDTNRNYDAYVWDARTDTNQIVTRGYDGAPADSATISRPSISSDGRFVCYSSSASNLVEADGNDELDIFLTDMHTGATRLVSMAAEGGSTNDASYDASMSPDGKFVVYASDASNLVEDDLNGVRDVFLFDVATGVTTLVTRDITGGGTNSSSYGPSISGDGSVIVFHSDASDLVADDTNAAWDVFAYERAAGTTELVSVAADGSGADDYSRAATVSADGTLVSFTSKASNLVPGDRNDSQDVFVTDRTTGVTTAVSTTSRGRTANDSSNNGAISADGTSVVFLSAATNLPVRGLRHKVEVYKIDLATRELILVSVGLDGRPGNRDSSAVSVTADGAYVAFSSAARNLADFDAKNDDDVFRYRAE